ncbi:putative nuclear serine protease HtrA2/Nma111 [Myriangium duriaei CBS 260.36]|uniref:Pro-apoptotic serine protease NMA111 n=1 Tax=Myriangium duriaei CBS 260.36 TaxID=1168546 RepID=A0A9P4J9J8_9PEZI|nr:putative nuclear serine protease HtrA2/Nma111 [Myriangium duriaei CBS 260.36]
MERGTKSRNKRKQSSPSQEEDRPRKQVKQNGAMAISPERRTSHITNGAYNDSDASEPEYDENGVADAEAHTLMRGATKETAEWQATIEKVITSVVSIHFCQTAPFDTDGAYASEATGFVVDAENGYIMTNRHVVGSGPFWGYCIFDNHEECDVHPVYRDPVHDFGILRFDPKAIKYMPLHALSLRPDLAKIGAEIRVVGNDAGEKLSILSGVISRLDRNAPEYGEGYCDFNTNYIQAAAAASGGSSGSPVVNIDGHVVALQAGGRADGAATDYFLPLDRPLRALEHVIRGDAVTRGSIQTQWLIKPFDECRRLGLTSNWESETRKQFPKETGMLVAEVILPKGPADAKLEEGDVLIKVNDELLTRFIRLDEILDESVGGQVKVLVQRGGDDVEVTVDVGDLHAITPDRFVSVCGASFHSLSYQQARYYVVALEGNGVYCCHASGSWSLDSGHGWLVQSVDNQPTPNLDSFIDVVKQIPDRKRVVVTCKHLRDMHTTETTVMYADRHWRKQMLMAVRNDKSGLWDYTNLADPVPPEEPKPQEATFIQMTGYPNQAAVDVLRSFVRVAVKIPLKLDGYPFSSDIGFGLVIDADQGLVIVSRATVPYSLCDISITIADSIIVDGRVIFLHPLQNYAIIQYDPALVKAPVKTAKLATKSITQGEETIFFGFNHHYRPVVVKTAVTDITSVTIPASVTMPRYRAVNLDAITVDTSVSERCGSGVLVSEDGTVQALWLSYLGDRSSSGKDTEYRMAVSTVGLLPVINEIKNGNRPELRILNLETQPMQMSEARIRGISEKWIERVQKEDSQRHQLFMVRKLDAGNTGGLQEGDTILTLDGKLITRITDFDIMYSKESLEVVVVRKNQELTITVPTVTMKDLETNRAVICCGGVFQEPHHAVRQQISKLHSNVYVSGRMAGSPAYMYGLAPTNFVTHVNGVATPDLDSFIAEANRIPNNTYFRLKLMTFDNQPWVVTLKKNEHYFPTQEFVKDESTREGWKRILYEDGHVKKDEDGTPESLGLDDGGAMEGADAE